MDILSSGDTVSELFLLLSGTAEVISPDPTASAQHRAGLVPQGDSLAQSVPRWPGEEGPASSLSSTSSSSSGGGLPGGDQLGGEQGQQHPFWGSSSGDIQLNPNSPISMDMAGIRRPVEEGSVLVSTAATCCLEPCPAHAMALLLKHTCICSTDVSAELTISPHACLPAGGGCFLH